MSDEVNEVGSKARPAELEDLELHDAIVSQISVLPRGDVLFHFDHVSTYHVDPAGRREVWSSKGMLRFSGVGSLSVDGMIDADDSIDDAFFFDEKGEQMAVVAAGSAVPIGRVEIQFANSPAKVRIVCSEATWALIEPVEKLEDWTD